MLQPDFIDAHGGIRFTLEVACRRTSCDARHDARRTHLHVRAYRPTVEVATYDGRTTYELTSVAVRPRWRAAEGRRRSSVEAEAVEVQVQIEGRGERGEGNM